MKTEKFSALMILLMLQIVTGDENFYKLSATDINGKEVNFENFRGKVVLIVNVASYCGYTKSHYVELVKLQSILGNKKKLIVLAFPCNQFWQQEPDSNSEISEFAQSVYKVNFPLFEKIDVVGENAHPVYQFLEAQTGKEPTWNFWKYLVSHTGKVLNAWGPGTSVTEIFDDVKAAVDLADTVSALNKEL